MSTYDSVISRSDAAALIPEEVASPIFAEVEQQSILSMCTRLPNMSRAQVRIPVASSLPVAYFVSPQDTGLKETSEVAWENKYIDAEELAVIVPIPENVIDDADYPLWEQIKPLLVGAFVKAIDAAVLAGTNAPAAWPDDLLTQITAASHLVDVSSDFAGDYFQAYLGADGAFSKVEQDGYNVNGVIALPSVKGILRGLKDSTNAPIFVQSLQSGGDYMLDGQPIKFVKNSPFAAASALSFQGDFKQLVWALRQDLRWKLLTEAVIQDGAGNIIYNLAQQDMVAIRVTMRLGWQVPNIINQTNTNAATRFPFSALKA